MKSIAIDDEPRALEVIDKFASKIDFLDLVVKFRDPIEAINYLMKNKIDLVFLDINMPGIFGIELVKVLKHQPMIIFTTAYSEYAVESYELGAIDYLLKPFEFERFLKAVIKAREFKNLSNERNTLTVDHRNVDSMVQIKSGSETYQVKVDDIRYIEGLGNYVKVYVNEEKIVTYSSLGDLLNMLPEKHFVRIHKSYIIAMKYIKSFEVHQVKLGSETIPIGKTYRKGFMELMKVGN